MLTRSRSCESTQRINQLETAKALPPGSRRRYSSRSLPDLTRDFTPSLPPLVRKKPSVPQRASSAPLLVGAPLSAKRRTRRGLGPPPTSWPPQGQRRIFHGAQMPYRLPAMNKLLDITALSDCLGRSPATIKSDLCRCPHTLPPGFKIGREWRWREEDVIAWVDAQVRSAREKFQAGTMVARSEEIPRRPGRPTKAEEIARRKTRM